MERNRNGWIPDRDHPYQQPFYYGQPSYAMGSYDSPGSWSGQGFHSMHSSHREDMTVWGAHGLSSQQNTLPSPGGRSASYPYQMQYYTPSHYHVPYAYRTDYYHGPPTAPYSSQYSHPHLQQQPTNFDPPPQPQQNFWQSQPAQALQSFQPAQPTHPIQQPKRAEPASRALRDPRKRPSKIRDQLALQSAREPGPYHPPSNTSPPARKRRRKISDILRDASGEPLEHEQGHREGPTTPTSIQYPLRQCGFCEVMFSQQPGADILGFCDVCLPKVKSIKAALPEPPEDFSDQLRKRGSVGEAKKYIQQAAQLAGRQRFDQVAHQLLDLRDAARAPSQAEASRTSENLPLPEYWPGTMSHDPSVQISSVESGTGRTVTRANGFVDCMYVDGVWRTLCETNIDHSVDTGSLGAVPDGSEG